MPFMRNHLRTDISIPYIADASKGRAGGDIPDLPRLTSTEMHKAREDVCLRYAP